MITQSCRLHIETYTVGFDSNAHHLTRRGEKKVEYFKNQMADLISRILSMGLKLLFHSFSFFLIKFQAPTQTQMRTCTFKGGLSGAWFFHFAHNGNIVRHCQFPRRTSPSCLAPWLWIKLAYTEPSYTVCQCPTPTQYTMQDTVQELNIQ